MEPNVNAASVSSEDDDQANAHALVPFHESIKHLKKPIQPIRVQKKVEVIDLSQEEQSD